MKLYAHYGFAAYVVCLGYKLIDELLKPGPLHAELLGFLPASKPAYPKWAVNRVQKKRFECEYSIQTGNITLYFEDKNRAKAERILGYYVNDLRDLLRAREIRATSDAIDSLEAEAASTPDELLRAQRYDLVAKQVQLKKVAQVEADFAFRVLDPPAASDKPYRPSVLLDCLMVALLTAIFSALRVIRKNPFAR